MSFTAEEYTELALCAEQEILASGRTVTIIQYGGTPRVAGKEWKGKTDIRSSPLKSVLTKAVFVNPGSAARLGMSTESSDLVKKSQQIMIVAPGNTITDVLSEFSEVQDAGTNWKIVGVQTLQPADKILLYYIGVKR